MSICNCFDSAFRGGVLVMGCSLLVVAGVSLVIGFPVSIWGAALYLLGVWVAVPLGCGGFGAFCGAGAPSPVWPDGCLAGGCWVSIIWSIKAFVLA